MKEALTRLGWLFVIPLIFLCAIVGERRDAWNRRSQYARTHRQAPPSRLAAKGSSKMLAVIGIILIMLGWIGFVGCLCATVEAAGLKLALFTFICTTALSVGILLTIAGTL